MDTNRYNLNELKGENPFKVPEGYMEGLTERIIARLPEQPAVEEEQKVTLADRIRPLLYLAAVFAGLGFFFKAIAPEEEVLAESSFLLVKAVAEGYDENQEYLEFLEEQYLDAMVTEEMEAEE